MAIGKDIALAVDLGQMPQQGGYDTSMIQQPGVQQQVAPTLDIAPPSGMQMVEDTTKNVYDKFYKVKQFATDLWNNYRIDVTKPDFSNPYSVRANQIYQKAIADLNYEIENLKQGQKIYNTMLQRGDNFYQGFNPTQESFSNLQSSPIVSKQLPPGVNNFLETYRKGFSSEDERLQANQELEKLQNIYKQKKEIALSQGDQASAEEADNVLNAIGSATYNRTEDIRQQGAMDRTRLTQEGATKRARIAANSRIAAAKAREYAKKSSAQKSLSLSFSDDWNSTRFGNTSVVESWIDSKGDRIFIPGSVRYSLTNGKIYGDKKDKKGNITTVSIDANNPNEFFQYAKKYGGYENLNKDSIKGISGKNKTTVYDGGFNFPLKPSDQWMNEIRKTQRGLTDDFTEDGFGAKGNNAMIAIKSKASSEGLLLPEGIAISDDGGLTSEGEKAIDVEYDPDDMVYRFKILRDVNTGNGTATNPEFETKEMWAEIPVKDITLKAKKQLNDIVSMNDVVYNQEAFSKNEDGKSAMNKYQDIAFDAPNWIKEKLKNIKGMPDDAEFFMKLYNDEVLLLYTTPKMEEAFLIGKVDPESGNIYE